ncbi:MAG: leucine-rich repeat protein, partial [Eubacteriales bacterium]|nr:leucine-rich repeat protein [Eubacteriales bacterium]
MKKTNIISGLCIIMAAALIASGCGAKGTAGAGTTATGQGTAAGEASAAAADAAETTADVFSLSEETGTGSEDSVFGMIVSSDGGPSDIADGGNSLDASGDLEDMEDVFETADGFMWRIYGDSAEIVSYVGDAKSVVIPETIEGRTVSSIGEKSFFHKTNITEVSIPKSVTSIGNAAFFACTRIESLKLPEGVKLIGSGAFAMCSSLKEISIPGSAVNLGKFCFAKDEQLENAVLGEGITVVPNQMFMMCHSLKKVVLPAGLKAIGDDAFFDCTVLSDITLPDGLETIGDRAFNSCFGLKAISIPCESLGSNIFAGCTLEELRLSDKLKSIRDGAFAGLHIDKLNIPASVESIDLTAFRTSFISEIIVDSGNKVYASAGGALFNKNKDMLIAYPAGNEAAVYRVPDETREIAPCAFEFTVNLQEVVLPEGLEVIGEKAFKDSMITKIELGSHLMLIGDEAFRGSHIKRVEIPGCIERIPRGCFSDTEELREIVLNEGLTQIEANAFGNVYMMESISIPASVKKIDSTAFRGCMSLKRFDVAIGNDVYRSYNGILYNNGDNELLCYPGGLEEENYEIPEGTVSIGNSAFEGQSFLRTVTFPGSVSRIGDRAFYDCSNLYSVEVPITVVSIGSEAFGYNEDMARGVSYLKPGVYLTGQDFSAARDYALKNDIAFFTVAPQPREESIKLRTGEEYTLTLAGLPTGESILYSSSDEAVVYTDMDGNLMGVSAGNAVVTAAVGTYYYNFDIEVTGETLPDAHTWSRAYRNNLNVDLGGYRELRRAELKDWEQAYENYNSAVSFEPLDNPCIGSYSTQEYARIFAAQGSEWHIST